MLSDEQMAAVPAYLRPYRHVTAGWLPPVLLSETAPDVGPYEWELLTALADARLENTYLLAENAKLIEALDAPEQSVAADAFTAHERQVLCSLLVGGIHEATRRLFSGITLPAYQANATALGRILDNIMAKVAEHEAPEPEPEPEDEALRQSPELHAVVDALPDTWPEEET